MPFAFPHIYYKEKVLIDGGSIWNLDIATAINRCKEIVGDKLEQITMDVVFCSSKFLDEK